MQQLKAVIIEDDLALGELFAEILDESGFQTVLIRDGAGAFQRLTETCPNIVLLDMHLPHVSGVEILTQIRGDDRLKTVKVLAITADARLAESVSSIADVTFLKPVGYKLVKDMVTRMTQPVASAESTQQPDQPV